MHEGNSQNRESIQNVWIMRKDPLIPLILFFLTGLPSILLAGDLPQQPAIKPISSSSFKGGIFQSQYDLLWKNGIIADDSSFGYYFFPDGLAVETTEPNVGPLDISRIGLWRSRRGRIECFFNGWGKRRRYFL
jgi:hypothetical protein